MNIRNVIKAVLFAFLSAIISTPLQILNSIYILKEDSPPEITFLIPIGIIGLIMKTLYATAYVLLGHKLPIRSQRLRAFAFIMVIWISDYLPQVLGLAGADGPIAEAAFSIPLVVCDSLSYFIDGILLGFLYKDFPYYKMKECSKINLLKTMVISAITFPILVFLSEQILGFIYSPLYCYNAMKVSDANIILFSVTFYGCFIITGALLPLVYRFTEYNTRNKTSLFKFGSIYSICLWAPVVLIMIAFGTSVLSTCVYIVVFIICITAVSYINDYLITG